MQWLAAHIKEAEDRLGKPLLLEEFGKKLDKNVGQEQFLKDIKEQRDPIFRTLLAIVKASVKTCALVGSQSLALAVMSVTA